MKFLYPPLFPYTIAQFFGENKACYRTVNGKIEVITKSQEAQCPFGYQSLYSMMKGHNGLDIVAYHGKPIFASHDGYVVEIQTEEARGLGIGILTDKKYHCDETGKDEYFKSRYWHLLSFSIMKGQYVKRGDLIGYADNTGYSSGDHCHFELKPVFIPIPDVSKVRDIDLINILQDNGYFGAINPLPYLITPELINVPIYYNNSGDSVNALQTMLKYLGYFPKEQTITGLYGNITKEAVYQFQLSNMNLSWYEKYILKGKTVGPRTLLAINNIIL